MASYSVLIKEAPADLLLVREGFSVPALLLGPLWFAFRRTWLAATIWCCGVALTVSAGIILGVAPGLYMVAVFVFMFFMALEASGFWQQSLLRRRYQLADIVEARDRNEAEIRFLARHASASVRPAEFRASEFQLRTGHRNGEAIGLFLNGT